jgi:hydroxyacylglutathione hydrolase
MRDAYKTMFQSLCRIAALPPETLVYPGHNYLKENLRFAATLPHDAAALKVRQSALLGNEEPPSTLAAERMTNPFLRAAADEAFAQKNAATSGDAEDSFGLRAFTALRIRKNNFT